MQSRVPPIVVRPANRRPGSVIKGPKGVPPREVCGGCHPRFPSAEGGLECEGGSGRKTSTFLEPRSPRERPRWNSVGCSSPSRVIEGTPPQISKTANRQSENQTETVHQTPISLAETSPKKDRQLVCKKEKFVEFDEDFCFMSLKCHVTTYSKIIFAKILQRKKLRSQNTSPGV